MSGSAQTPAALNTPTVDLAPQSAGLVLTRSEFERVGKDPFFPKSTRLMPVKAADVPEPVVTFTELTLKGTGRGVAIINNRTFAIGEEADIRIKGVPRKVMLVKIINENKVVVQVGGVTQELTLSPR